MCIISFCVILISVCKINNSLLIKFVFLLLCLGFETLKRTKNTESKIQWERGLKNRFLAVLRWEIKMWEKYEKLDLCSFSLRSSQTGFLQLYCNNESKKKSIKGACLDIKFISNGLHYRSRIRTWVLETLQGKSCTENCRHFEISWEKKA